MHDPACADLVRKALEEAHRQARAADPTVPPRGAPYWSLNDGRLLSTIGLWGLQSRLANAASSLAEWDDLTLMSSDPDPQLRELASLRQTVVNLRRTDPRRAFFEEARLERLRNAVAPGGGLRSAPTMKDLSDGLLRAGKATYWDGLQFAQTGEVAAVLRLIRDSGTSYPHEILPVARRAGSLGWLRDEGLQEVERAAAQRTQPAQRPQTTPQASTKSGGCYVATAVYGSYDCPEVWVLRRFRDQSLAPRGWGRVLVRAYYAVSPLAVKRGGRGLRAVARGPLDTLVAHLLRAGVASTPYTDA